MSASIIISAEQGPQGPQGPQGIPGVIPSMVVNNISADYVSATMDDILLVSGLTQITLPDAATYSKSLTIKNVGTSTVTLVCQLTQTIESLTSLQITEKNSSVDLISNGFNWFIT